MTATTHTLDATIPVGDPDLGAEVDLRITYTYHPRVPEQGPTYSSGGQPAEGETSEFVSAVQIVNGKELPRSGAFADLEQSSIDAWAADYVEANQAELHEHALDDLERD